MAGLVLVVDDEAHILQVLSFKLRSAGYTVLTAVDGEEGLEIARSERPDLVITDVQMPYMTGLELCRALAAEPATQSIPVLILTARGHAIDDADLAVGNIREVISKPFSPRVILQRVAAHVEAAGEGAEAA